MHADFLAVFRAMGSDSAEFLAAMASSLLSMNGEAHKRYRATVAPLFTPRAVESVRPVARTEAHIRIDEFPERGIIEFIGSFASPYVSAITGSFLGLARDELDECIHYVHLLGSRRQDPRERLEDLQEGLIGLTRYVRSLLNSRKSARADDIISAIADLVDRNELPEPVAVSLVAGLLSAGHDPTVNQLGLMIEVLSEHPETWNRVTSGDVVPAAVIEEVLRYRSTNRQVIRRVAESFEYDGVPLSQDEQVVIRLSEANHDPDRFAAADEFDIEANRGPHVAFGFGPHFCLGAALARLQLQEALRALAVRISCPIVVSSAQRDEAMGIVGPHSLSIRVDAIPAE